MTPAVPTVGITSPPPQPWPANPPPAVPAAETYATKETAASVSAAERPNLPNQTSAQTAMASASDAKVNVPESDNKAAPKDVSAKPANPAVANSGLVNQTLTQEATASASDDAKASVVPGSSASHQAVMTNDASASHQLSVPLASKKFDPPTASVVVSAGASQPYLVEAPEERALPEPCKTSVATGGPIATEAPKAKSQSDQASVETSSASTLASFVVPGAAKPVSNAAVAVADGNVGPATPQP
eukprot:scaffold73470_cov37-Prasinocladus_malaysianus.AAC.1